MKKLLLYPFVIIFIMSLNMPAFAQEGRQSNTHDYANNKAIIAQAERQNESFTGQGYTNTATDTRTREQIEDDNNEARIEELMKLISDTLSEMGNLPVEHGINNPQMQFPNQTLPQPALPEWTLPEFTLPDWFLPEWILPEFTLPQINFDFIPLPQYLDKFESNEEPMEGNIYVPTDNGFVVVNQTHIPISQLIAYLSLLNNYNNTNYNFKLPNLPTLVTSYDKLVNFDPQFSIQMDIDLLKWFQDMMDQLGLLGYPELQMPPQLENPNLWALDDFFGGSLEMQDIGGLIIGVPTRNDILYLRLLEYLRELQALGQTSVNITRMTVYNVQKYAYQTIKQAVPHNEYRWVVKGGAESIDTYTQSPYIKMLFQSAGTYQIKVYNTQDITRNNKVSGVKTELWLIGEGNIFNGLVIYNNSSTFTSFISDDIGPITEEIELIEDGFIANVTSSMIDKVQMIDSNGNIHAASDGYTTERR